MITLSKLQAFVAELRRRKVVRTGAAYAIGAAALWQGVDVMAPALGWSDRVLTFFVVGAIALAPLVLALAWVFELKPEEGAPSQEEKGLAPTNEPESVAEDGGNKRPRWVVPTTLAGAALSLVIAWALWPSSLGGVADFGAGDETLISRCESTEGDPDLAAVLNTALEAALRQSTYVTIASHDRARAFAQTYLARTPPVVVDGTLANELGVRWGLKVVIHCAIRQVGNTFQVSATLTAPEDQRNLAVLSEASDEEGLIDAIDALSASTREALGESLNEVRASRPLAEVTTSSLSALRSYTAGFQAELRGDWDRATQHFLAAVERDTLFARAHAALGARHYWSGDRPNGEARYRLALQLPERMSDRDRLWIEASWASSRGDPDRAVALLREYVELWPTDPSAWYNLGTQYFRARNCDDAGDAFGRALKLNPQNAGAHVNLASCLANEGSYDSSLVHYDSAFTLRPTWRQTANLNHEYGFVLVRAGLTDQARSLFEAQMQLDESLGAGGTRSAALLSMYEGHYNAASELLEEAVRLRQTLPFPLSEVRDRSYLSGVYSVLGRNDEAQAQLDRIEDLLGEFYVSPSWLQTVARRAIPSGRIDLARSLASRAAADTLVLSAAQRAAVILAEAEINAVDGDLEEALEKARIATRLAPTGLAPHVLCRFALLADEIDEAREVCGSVIAANAVGWEAQESTTVMHYWLGQLEERQGNPDAAVGHYSALLEVWGEADSGLRFHDIDGTRVEVVEIAKERVTALAS